MEAYRVYGWIDCNKPDDVVCLMYENFSVLVCLQLAVYNIRRFDKLTSSWEIMASVFLQDVKHIQIGNTSLMRTTNSIIFLGAARGHAGQRGTTSTMRK
jgi:hypothetical protein